MPESRGGYAVCPECGVHCWIDVMSGKEPNLVEIKDVRHVETDWGSGQNWTEVWKCPACGNVFEEGNGFP